jgi:hypothetical protein
MMPWTSVRMRTPEVITIASLMDSTSYWWDASDATTITKNGSDQVSQLDDKSGNGNHLTQGTDGNKPLANVSMNGVDCIDCRPAKFMSPTANPFLFGVREVFSVLWSERANPTDNAFVLTMPGASTTNTTVGTAKITIGGSSITHSAVFDGNGTMNHTLIQHHYNEGTGATTQHQVIDGRIRSAATTTTGLGGTRLAFAANGAGAAPLNGLFCEMVVFNRALTEVERAAVINELTLKWRAIEPVTKYHIVLLAGQSNMRGAYGPVELTTDATNPRIAMLEREYVPTTGAPLENDEGPIVLAENPLSNRWKDSASPPGENTLGPGLSYAKALLATLPSDEGVLLVPCAQGATYVMPRPPLSPDVTWAPVPDSGWPNTPFVDAVDRTNRMILAGHELHSILWCQGENEAARPTMAEATYAGYFDAVVNALRAQITGATNTPFIAMQIGSFLSGGSYPNAANVNAAIADLPNRLSNTAYVSNSGYTSGGDSLHYDAASARAIGAAMFTAYGTI